ncbi:MAG: ActS/PrrB/RegB family redox-sensitive histidine kinase [Sphingomonadales bacterium]
MTSARPEKTLRGQLAALAKSSRPAGDDGLLAIDSGQKLPSAGQFQAGVRAGTLLNLRWLAILGQIAAIAFVQSYLRFELPLMALGAGVAASIAFNVGLLFWFGTHSRLNSRQAGLQLVFDLLQLCFLLYFTGGLQNPFAIMILLPLTISATMLSGRATMLMLALATACLLVLTRAHLPLPWAVDEPIQLPATYLLGLWAGITVSMVFIAAYTYRVSSEARSRAASVVALQSALSREQRLSAVGSLAAAAAHELGTPLGTISLVVRDLKDNREDYPSLAHDIDLLESETERCRQILADISRRSHDDAEHFRRMPILAIVEEVTQNYEGRGIGLELNGQPLQSDDGQSPIVARAPELRHGVANIISNAVRFAATTVSIDVTWDQDSVHILVHDDGPGFDEDILPRLGVPYIGSQPGRDGDTGMGLGLFIANTLLARTGAQLEFDNEEDGGAVVEISWDRAHIEEEGDTWGNPQ